MENIFRLWKPVELNNKWEDCDTSIIDDISSSWFEKRKKLKKGTGEYSDFLNRLRHEHAIETGIVEKLYDLKKGITETFIKEGFAKSYLSHGELQNIFANRVEDWKNKKIQEHQELLIERRTLKNIYKMHSH